jgi:23S rRNA maturation-related 3'-5' exoribonuclease YhaM
LGGGGTGRRKLWKSIRHTDVKVQVLPAHQYKNFEEDIEMKKQIIELLRSTNRPGIENLINYLENESDFFTAPCSTQYHGCKEGGLAEHSLNVCEFGTKHLSNLIDNNDSWVIVSLLHDIGKSTYYGKPNYIPNILKSGKQSEDKPYTSNSERCWIPHEVSAIHIISKYIELTEDEAFAIYGHNGLYTPAGNMFKGNETPLQLLLHFADMWASRFIEKGASE